MTLSENIFILINIKTQNNNKMSRVPHKHVSQHPTLMVPLQMISLGNDGNMRGGGGDMMLMLLSVKKCIAKVSLIEDHCGRATLNQRFGAFSSVDWFPVVDCEYYVLTLDTDHRMFCGCLENRKQ